MAGAAAYALSDGAPVRRIDVRESGLVGTLFLPGKHTGLPAVVSLSGAMGGLFEAPAEALAQAGFPTLALATHNTEGRPPKLRLLPVEYVIDGVEWLRTRVTPAGGAVALRGWSRGGELALLAASLSPSVNAVIAYAPRCYVGREQDKPNNFDDPKAVAAFTWRGAPVEGAPLPEDMRVNRVKPSLEDRYGIAVERIAGPTMFVTGSADTGLAGTTPDSSCDRAMRRLELFKSPWRRVHDHYPDAGHDIAGPPPFSGPIEGGGTVAGNTAAVAASWLGALAFLRTLTTP
jgi:dienelactone hydrolase